MRQDLAKRLAALEGPKEGATRLVLRDLGGGRYRHMGTGRTYTADDVRRMGDAVLIVGIQTVQRRMS